MLRPDAGADLRVMQREGRVEGSRCPANKSGAGILIGCGSDTGVLARAFCPVPSRVELRLPLPRQDQISVSFLSSTVRLEGKSGCVDSQMELVMQTGNGLRPFATPGTNCLQHSSRRTHPLNGRKQVPLAPVDDSRRCPPVERAHTLRWTRRAR